MNDYTNLNLSPDQLTQGLASLLNGSSAGSTSTTLTLAQAGDQIVLTDPNPVSTSASNSTGTALAPSGIVGDNYLTGQQPTSTTGQTPAQVTALINQAVQQSPDLQTAVKAMPGQQGQAFSAQVLQNVEQKIATLNPPITPNMVAKALGETMGKQLLSMIQNGTGNPTVLAPILDQVRVDNFSLSNPTMGALVEIVYNQLLEQGLSPAQAQLQANSQVLSQIDNNLAEEGVTKTVISNNPNLTAAITQTLNSVLKPLVGTVDAPILAGGLMATGGVAAMVSNLSQSIVNVNQTTGPSPTFGAQMTKVAAGAVKTMNDQIAEIVEAEKTLQAGGAAETSTQWMFTLTLMMSKMTSLVNEMQISDVKNENRINAAQIEIQKQESINQLKQLSDQMNAEKPKPWWIKFLMVFFAVIVAIVMAVVTVVTFGATSPILAAVMCVFSAAITAVAASGVLTTAITDLMDLFARALSKLMPAAEAKVFLATMMVIVAVIIAVISDGAAASVAEDLVETVVTDSVETIAEDVAEDVTMTTLQKGILTMSIQGIAVLVTSSGLFENIAACCTSDPVKQAIIEGVLTLIFMVATVVVGGYVGSMKTIEQIAEDAKEEVQSVTESILYKIQTYVAPALLGVAQIGQAGLSVYNGVIGLQKAEVEEEIAELRSAIVSLESIITMLQGLLKGFQTSDANLQSLAQSLNDSFNRIMSQSSSIISNLF